MPIMKYMKRIPGGMMVVPLLLGAIINTLVPEALNIGGFTTALFKDGSMSVLGLFVLCMGSQINFKQAGVPLAKGVSFTAVKFIIGAGIGWLVGHFMGPNGLLGLTPIAIIGALTNSNGGLYAALAGEFGDSGDVGAISVLSLNDGPFFTMLALGVTGLANIPFSAFLATLIPIIIGMILGNLDEDWRKLLAKGQDLLIPFFAFPLGAALDFRTIYTAGLSGILLGLMTVILTGLGGYIVIKYGFKERKGVGMAIGTTAGNAVATPAAIAAVDPSLNAIVPSATAQIAAAVIISAVLCPLLTSYLDKKEKVALSS